MIVDIDIIDTNVRSEHRSLGESMVIFENGSINRGCTSIRGSCSTHSVTTYTRFLTAGSAARTHSSDYYVTVYRWIAARRIPGKRAGSSAARAVNVYWNRSRMYAGMGLTDS